MNAKAQIHRFGAVFVRHGRPSPRPTTVPVAATSSAEGRFDWVDAGIGAAAVLGLGLVGSGAMLVTRTQRRRAALSQAQLCVRSRQDKEDPC